MPGGKFLAPYPGTSLTGLDMDHPTVTTVSLRLAVRRLAEISCGTAPTSVRVAVMPSGADRTYAVLIPFEYRAEVHHYLAEHTSVPIPADGGALVLSSDQALALIDLAYRRELEPAPLCEQKGPVSA
jgi:hypothetical protein